MGQIEHDHQAAPQEIGLGHYSTRSQRGLILEVAQIQKEVIMNKNKSMPLLQARTFRNLPIARVYENLYSDPSTPRKMERFPESHGDLADQANEEIADEIQNRIDAIRRRVKDTRYDRHS